MKITEIEYQRVQNLGDYETQRLSAKGVIEEGENINKSFKKLKRYVNKQLHIEEISDKQMSEIITLLKDLSYVVKKEED